MKRNIKKSWNRKLEEIMKQIDSFKKKSMDNYIVYRGQSDFGWSLTPSLYVAQQNCGWNNYDLEEKEFNIYFDFVTNAKGYINNSMKSWEILVEMRHFGLPVRVLDWTESLNAALYFAVIDTKVNQKFSDRKEDAVIYLLDPFALNDKTLGDPKIYNPLDKRFFEFEDAILEKDVPKRYKNKLNNPYAIIMPRRTDRIFAQKGLFTVQGFNNKDIDKIAKLKPTYSKIIIEREYFKDIANYLEVSGVNHFTMYPDFQGLSMYIKEYYKL